MSFSGRQATGVLSFPKCFTLEAVGQLWEEYVMGIESAILTLCRIFIRY